MIGSIEQFAREHQLLLNRISIAGWAAFGLGSLASSLRSGGRERLIWLTLAALASLFAYEMFSPHRYEIAVHLRSAARGVGGEDFDRGRRPVQAVVVAASVVVAVGLLARLLGPRVHLAAPVRMSVIGSGIGILGLTLETISLHQIDAYSVIYWAFCFAGIATGLAGVFGGIRVPGRPEPSAGPTAHARYRIADLALDEGAEPARRRILRLACVMVALTIPEWVALIARRIRPGPGRRVP